ncbi:MAG: GAF domain-containing protein [Gammaproteobacteria bacterium]|nr:MAG: GAF domain-containing protein [Gammaproteobacteria bacterium]
MIVAPLPSNEFLRLQSLQSLNILDTQPDERFDCITRFAAEALSVPICLVSLVDTNRQWFKSVVGLEVTETARTYSFCAHAILKANACDPDSRIFEIEDAYKDIRFHDNPLVLECPWIRSYLGYVLQTKSGLNIGTLCLIGIESRKFTDSEKNLLTVLGNMVENIVNGCRFSAGIEYELNTFID